MAILMRNRLSSYFLIAAAVIFTAVQGFAIIKHVRLETRLTAPDYINSAKIIIALLAVIVGVRTLARDEQGGQ
jgi:hypothetical protein